MGKSNLKTNSKSLATSFTATVFAIVGTTGVLMYFHILDKYTKNLHEILGLFFVGVVFFHVFFNWKAMKNYFTKKLFYAALILTIIVSSSFIYEASNKVGENPKGIILKSVLNADLKDALKVLNVDYEKAKIKLSSKEIEVFDNESISEIGKNNGISPYEIVNIVSN